jgi:hypothetical protein
MPSLLSKPLSNEMWREVVAFFPVAMIVRTDYTSTTDNSVITTYKLERYLKLKEHRNRMLAAVFYLWHTSCGLRDSLKRSPVAEHERIQKERQELKEKIFAELAVLFHLFELPWPYPKIVSLGVTYRSKIFSF